MRYALNEAAINTYQTLAGSGASTLELQTAARGTTVKRGSGLSTLELVTAARGTTLKWGSGLAQLELQASAGGYPSKTGSGSTVLELLTRQAFPSPVPVPTAWSETHPSRRLIVAPQPSDTLPGNALRTLTVPAQDRTVLVPPERMQ